MTQGYSNLFYQNPTPPNSPQTPAGSDCHQRSGADIRIASLVNPTSPKQVEAAEILLDLHNSPFQRQEPNQQVPLQQSQLDYSVVNRRHISPYPVSHRLNAEALSSSAQHSSQLTPEVTPEPCESWNSNFQLYEQASTPRANIQNGIPTASTLLPRLESLHIVINHQVREPQRTSFVPTRDQPMSPTSYVSPTARTPGRRRSTSSNKPNIRDPRHIYDEEETAYIIFLNCQRKVQGRSMQWKHLLVSFHQRFPPGAPRPNCMRKSGLPDTYMKRTDSGLQTRWYRLQDGLMQDWGFTNKDEIDIRLMERYAEQLQKQYHFNLPPQFNICY